MRVVSLVMAVVGGVTLALGAALALWRGDLAQVGWLVVGPGPFCVAGIIAVLRRPGHPVVGWLVATGTAFAVDVFLGDIVLPSAGGSPVAWVVTLVRSWMGMLSVVAGAGLVGLFPTGLPQRAYERWTLRAAAAAGLLAPPLYAVASPTMPRGLVDVPTQPDVASPLYVPRAAPLRPIAETLHGTFWLWIVVGLALLWLRYRRASADDGRLIRWLLVGVAAASFVWPLFTAPVWALGPSSLAVVSVAAWLIVVIMVLGSLTVAISHGVLGIDRPARRAAASGSLRALVLGVSTAAAAMVGLVASRYLPVGATVLVAVLATLLLQPAGRWLEQLADRWVFGARLGGYEALTRFGAALASSPGPDQVLGELAEVVRLGLGVRWARVVLEAGGEAATAGRPEEPPALVVPLTHGGGTLGRIECGARRDGVLVEEDRRLLSQLATQAATVVRNVQLTAELTASRARIAQAQDDERRRIQRDLHDGVQQDVVVLTTTLAMARERLRRADPRTDDTLAELQRDLAALLGSLREFAHAIHPPVLADQGLLEAVEAQAARMPLEVVVEADPALRGVRYPQRVETAAWYVLSEALTNAVKHADARRVAIAVRQLDGRLIVEVCDDGRGFDPAAAHGLGLSGLADRMSIVEGELHVTSAPSRGTTLRALIPVTGREREDG